MVTVRVLFVKFDFAARPGQLASGSLRPADIFATAIGELAGPPGKGGEIVTAFDHMSSYCIHVSRIRAASTKPLGDNSIETTMVWRRKYV
jgi:hypothetical protein